MDTLGCPHCGFIIHHCEEIFLKRGETTTDETVTIIAIAAATLVLIVWYISFHGSINDTKDIEACRTSVQAYAASMGDTPGADFHLFDIDCQRRVITFTEDKVELNGKNHRYFDISSAKTKKSYSDLTSDIVNSVAASEMSTCWYQFLEGKVRWSNEIDIGNDNTACYVCSEIRFEEDYGVSAEPFFDFLKMTESRPYPKPFNEERPLYFDYLYMAPRVCEHRLSDYFTQRVPEGDWFVYSGRETCEKEFFKYITQDWRKVPVQLDLIFTQIKFWDFEIHKTPILDETIELSSDNSYVVMFYQFGKDWGETDDGTPTGTSYAPLIMKSSDLDTTVCETFLG